MHIAHDNKVLLIPLLYLGLMQRFLRLHHIYLILIETKLSHKEIQHDFGYG